MTKGIGVYVGPEGGVSQHEQVFRKGGQRVCYTARSAVEATGVSADPDPERIRDHGTHM